MSPQRRAGAMLREINTPSSSGRIRRACMTSRFGGSAIPITDWFICIRDTIHYTTGEFKYVANRRGEAESINCIFKLASGVIILSRAAKPKNPNSSEPNSSEPWLRAEREARSESTSIIWEKSQYDGRPAGRGHALWTLISLERDDQFTNGHLNTMSPSNQSCI